MVKPRAREAARSVRRAIAPEERAVLSARIREQVLSLPELSRARVVGCYVSVRSEVDTTLLLRELLVRNLAVAVPVTHADRLTFARLDHPWVLAPGAHDIPEPREPRTDVSGDDLDIIFLPGLQFGRDGTRLGSGGGYFDRFLAAHPRALRAALAFDAQVVDVVPGEEHDEAMDVIITESGRIRVGRAANKG